MITECSEKSQNNFCFCNMRYDANYYLERFGPKTQGVVLGERERKMNSIGLDQFKQNVDNKLS